MDNRMYKPLVPPPRDTYEEYIRFCNNGIMTENLKPEKSTIDIFLYFCRKDLMNCVNQKIIEYQETVSRDIKELNLKHAENIYANRLIEFFNQIMFRTLNGDDWNNITKEMARAIMIVQKYKGEKEVQINVEHEVDETKDELDDFIYNSADPEELQFASIEISLKAIMWEFHLLETYEFRDSLLNTLKLTQTFFVREVNEKKFKNRFKSPTIVFKS